MASGGAQQTARGNSLSFFGDDADGWNMSPKSILLFSVAYMGCVISLHIFGKITSIKGKTTDIPEPGPDTGAGDLWEFIIDTNKSNQGENNVYA